MFFLHTEPYLKKASYFKAGNVQEERLGCDPPHTHPHMNLTTPTHHPAPPPIQTRLCDLRCFFSRDIVVSIFAFLFSSFFFSAINPAEWFLCDVCPPASALTSTNLKAQISASYANWINAIWLIYVNCTCVCACICMNADCCVSVSVCHLSLQLITSAALQQEELNGWIMHRFPVQREK